MFPWGLWGRRGFVVGILWAMPLVGVADGFVKAELYLSDGVSAKAGYLGRHSLGIEGLHKLGGQSGDRATILYQLRLTRYRSLDMDNRVSEDMNTWEPEVHTTYVNVKGFFGRLNLKAGHLEIPFGLEPVVDTHTTLVPSAAMVNFGAMNDWGFSLNGQLRPFDYEVAWTTGAGMEASWNPFERDPGTYLLAARIQPTSRGNARYGFSVLFGTMSAMTRSSEESEGHLSDHPMSFRKERRLGLDYRDVVFVFSRGFDLQLETAFGTRNDEGVFSLDGSLSHEFGVGWKWTAGMRWWSEGPTTRNAWATISFRKQLRTGLALEALISRDFYRRPGVLDTSFLTLLYWTR